MTDLSLQRIQGTKHLFEIYLTPQLVILRKQIYLDSLVAKSEILHQVHKATIVEVKKI